MAQAFSAHGLQPTLVHGRAHPEVVGASDVAIVASGTATLETGLMLRPMVVVYRMSTLSWWMGKLLVKVAFVSLVNLLTGRRVVPELLQGALEPGAVAAEVQRIWEPGRGAAGATGGPARAPQPGGAAGHRGPRGGRGAGGDRGAC